MLLPTGATIRCRDGAAGRLKYVVIDPDDGEVTHLIVERGMLLRRDIVVPAGWVERASEDEIVLNATVADLKALPEYHEIDFIEPDPSYRPLSGHRVEETRIWVSPYVSIGGGRPWILRRVRLGIQDDEVLLRRGLPVQTRDGRTAGALDHLVVEPASHRITHLVVRRGWLWDRQARIVPLERVAALTDYSVQLNMGAEELDQAPPYRPPASDAQIATSLQQALETDPRTRAAGLSVDIQDGVVRFVGEATDAVMDAARAIARRMRGVIGFADDVVAPPAPPLKIGAPVYARDGRYGMLDKVVVDPHARRVTHVVVRQGWLLTEDRVIPIERVERAEPDGVYLDAAAAELDQYPRYREEAFVEPLEGWEPLEPYSTADALFWGRPYIGVAPPVLPTVEHVVAAGVPEGEIVLRRGADVFYEDGVVGSLDHVLFDPTRGVVTHLVVQEHRRSRRVVVPAEWIREINAEAITLNHWNPYQPGVPAYEAARDDAEIYADLKMRLNANPTLSTVQVQVDRGVARLSGNVPTVADKATADAIARGTPGVIDVDNALSADTALVGQVTAELAADRRTALVPIEVIADRGVVTLQGAVPTPEIKTAAEAIARRVPGVVTVVNELEVRRPKPESAPVPVAWALPR
jgi:osmotically-inducible protein OsmY/sporulation protein YlmC with PRC-barrel domain